MFDYKNLDAQAKQYFDSLPAFLQENIMQSSVGFTSREELETYHRTMMEQGKTYNPS